MISTRAIDDTNEVQDIINDACANRVAAELRRKYVVRKTIKIPSSEGLHIFGHHLYGTGIVWRGSEGAIFYRPNSRDGLCENFSIDVQESAGSAFIDTNLNYPSSDSRHDATMIVPTNNQHDRLRIMGNDRLFVYRSIQIGNCDENNEAHSDIDVHVNGVIDGWHIDGSQSKYHEMMRCRYFGGKYGRYAVLATHGSFSWLGGGGSHAGVAFFRIMNQADTIALHRADVETCARFAMIEGPSGQTGVSQAIEISGGRFMCDQVDDMLRAIVMRTAGPLVIRNFQLGNGTQKVCCIHYDADHGALEIVGTDFGAFGSTFSNSVITTDGVSVHMSNSIFHDSNGESYVG